MLLNWNLLNSHSIAKKCICCRRLKVAMHDCKAATPTRAPCFLSAHGCLSAGSFSLRPAGQIWGPVVSRGSCCQATEAPGLITPLPHSWTASSLTSLLNSICQRKGSMWDTKTKHVGGNGRTAIKVFLFVFFHSRVKLQRTGILVIRQQVLWRGAEQNANQHKPAVSTLAQVFVFAG